MATSTASLLLFCITPPGLFLPLPSLLLLLPPMLPALLLPLPSLLLFGSGWCHRNFSGRPQALTNQSSIT